MIVDDWSRGFCVVSEGALGSWRSGAKRTGDRARGHHARGSAGARVRGIDVGAPVETIERAGEVKAGWSCAGRRGESRVDDSPR